MARGALSFDEFAVEHLPRLLRFADVLTGEHQLAEDVVQEVLIRTQTRWNRIGSLDAPEAYLRRMIVNQLISWRRQRARMAPRIVLEDLATIPGDTDYATVHAERDELAARLGALPPKQRAAVVMRFYAGLPDTEIATALGCSEVTVRSHISRALTRLRIAAAAPALMQKES